MENFNNFFSQSVWNPNKNLLHHTHQQQPPNARSEITSTEKGAMSTGQQNSILAPSKLAQAQPPHSTNRDLTSLPIDNRLYMDGYRHQQQPRQNSFNNGSLTISPAAGVGGNSRDNNNNGLNSGQSMSFSSQKLLSRLDIDTIRSNINSNRNVGSCGGGNNLIHHQHGTILFNTLNGGALGVGSNGMMQGSSAECFNGPDLVDSTTPPPTAISMPPASSASSSSSTISTNIGLTRSSNGSQDGNSEKIKTPNSIRGKSKITYTWRGNSELWKVFVRSPKIKTSLPHSSSGRPKQANKSGERWWEGKTRLSELDRSGETLIVSEIERRKKNCAPFSSPLSQSVSVLVHSRSSNLTTKVFSQELLGSRATSNEWIHVKEKSIVM